MYWEIHITHSVLLHSLQKFFPHQALHRVKLPKLQIQEFQKGDFLLMPLPLSVPIFNNFRKWSSAQSKLEVKFSFLKFETFLSLRLIRFLLKNGIRNVQNIRRNMQTLFIRRRTHPSPCHTPEQRNQFVKIKKSILENRTWYSFVWWH